MPKVFTYQLPTSIYFLLPLKVEQEQFAVTTSVSLVHPLLKSAMAARDLIALHAPDEKLLWFGASHLTLRSTDDNDPLTGDYQTLDLVLTRLRRLSRQAGIPRTFVS